MGFLQAIIQTLVTMIIVGAFAFAGIMLGRALKRFTDKRKEEEN